MRNTSLGQMIRARRKEIGLTAEELARKAGIDRTYLSRIERHGFLPTPKVLIKIVSNLKDKSSKYTRLYESLKFGGAIKQWRRQAKTLSS